MAPVLVGDKDIEERIARKEIFDNSFVQNIQKSGFIESLYPKP